jgi:hypothetical protein
MRRGPNFLKQGTAVASAFAAIVWASAAFAARLGGGAVTPNGYTSCALINLTQDSDDSDENQVPATQVEKYIAVYKAMHRDRSLTVEQAAAQQGMTLTEFRDLENRVQRDDAAMEHVRDELQESAVHASPAAPPGNPSSGQ